MQTHTLIQHCSNVLLPSLSLAGGPLQCDDTLYNIGEATLVLLVSFRVLITICCCYGCFNNYGKPSRKINPILNGSIYCLCILIALAFIVFLIWVSISVFLNLGLLTSDDCTELSVVPIVSIGFIYAGSLLFLCCCMCCCCVCMKAMLET